jgi:hypothetical protein
MSRPQMTLIDYVIIAITPALIMVLIGSLVHFLIAVFYGGGFGGRLNYVMTLFVFASVLIARIAIDEGRERSILFAIPLALATLFVAGKFVQFQGPLAPLSTVINAGLIILIMWCADRLTWDCTVIDERKDVSGEGLLQTAGLDRPDADNAADDRRPVAPSGSAPSIDVDAQATSGREPPPVPSSWWERFLEHRKRPHAPGVWVIYVSLAALPLFGIGQRFVPEADVEARRYLFRLMCYFVGSALGLLMTSSFLGIRRYLRHRRLEMPAEMTGVWLLTGSVMILVLLFACALLPRPSAEYSVPNALSRAVSPDDLRASRYGRGNEGARDDQDRARNTATSGDQQSAKQGESGRSGSSSDDPHSGSPSNSPSDSSGGDQQGQSKAGDAAGDRGSPGGESSGEQRQSANNARSEQRPGDAPQQPQAKEKGGESPRGANQRPSDKSQEQQQPQQKQRPQEDRQQEQQQQQQQQQQQGTSASSANDDSNSDRDAGKTGDQRSGSSPTGSRVPSAFSPSQIGSSLLGGMSFLLKGLYYLFFLVLVGYLLWRYWDQVLKALSDFVQAFRDFWSKLFGGSDAQAPTQQEAPVAAAAPRPWADYSDPFLSGAAERYTPQQLLAYSFEALQAWGREHGCEHQAEQTPHEYAMYLGRQNGSVGREARRLADLYSIEAYSGGSLPRAQVQILRQLWQVLKSARAAEAPVLSSPAVDQP